MLSAVLRRGPRDKEPREPLANIQGGTGTLSPAATGTASHQQSHEVGLEAHPAQLTLSRCSPSQDLDFSLGDPEPEDPAEQLLCFDPQKL